MLALLLACETPDPSPPRDSDTPPPDTDDIADTADTTDTADTAACPLAPGPPDDKRLPGPDRAAKVLTGTITWSLDFDASAETRGLQDCTYTRVYAEQIEVGDQGWLCPACDVLTTGTAVMTEGYDTCFVQIDDADQERVEHLGIGKSGGAPHFFRSGVENVRLADMGPLGGDGAVSWEDRATLDEGGAFALVARGSITVATSADVLLADVTGARTEPYTCGWPQNNPGGPVPRWALGDGSLFPNARLVDQCDEPVDIWDFRGYYLVIDASAPNCGPCQLMASEAEAFKARMAEVCVHVELVTLLAESLSAINHPADLATREDWVETFALTSPVLADEGFGYALFPDYIGTPSGMSFPSIVVVDPEGRVLMGTSGFSDFAEIEAAILADL